ncbi:hypothetical protein GCM10022223_42840 [Kineosporia mesophila]|uniref:DUF2399 domain-containing protein n=1 Tax=Kineosporia mesophila TaxID=566012 RepID=A0ABP6ZZP4_9ACTN|nr:hypothetical protein [Kineosporia mesophila]MCD5353277.1 hypothetical protein [Kineosporia mesophila]
MTPESSSDSGQQSGLPALTEFAMRDLPSIPPGTTPYATAATAGKSIRTVKGAPRPQRVELRSELEDLTRPPERPASGVDDQDWSWCTSQSRKWSTAQKEFEGRAWRKALALVQVGAIRLVYEFPADLARDTPLRWDPHPRLLEGHQARRSDARDGRARLRDQADALADRLDPEWPGVATALLETAPGSLLEWTVRAATDLEAGRRHGSARAFVQAHAHHTKVRERVAQEFIRAGFDLDALTRLGINRSPYVGLAGPMAATLPTGVTQDFTGWPGPQDVRLSPRLPVTVSVTVGTRVLVVMENRQAAETVCDEFPHVALIWCHGQPPAPVLEVIAQAALGVERVLICPDADLGGIRIADRIDRGLPARVERTVIDVGREEHEPGAPFSEPTRRRIAAQATGTGAVAALARGCLDRGYLVEQEAPIRIAVERALTQ